MKKQIFTLALFLAMPAYAASVTVAWDANPPEENVTRYVLRDGARVAWEGPQTQATVELANGAHTLTVVACSQWTNGDGTKGELCSEPSLPVTGTVSGNPKAFRVK